ncbi:MAG: ABC transporter ATP-binding protein [Alphaproteobacteria bacterium]|nr:ABC transporter ATP-binding protein [Alphaproteobacteria bacterium]
MIQITNLTKRFDSILALNNISLNIKHGEFYGLLGPNGAGKTTLISLMCALQLPDSGTITINGLNVHRHNQNFKMQIGLVPQELALYEELSAWDNIMIFGRLFKIPSNFLKQTAESYLKQLGLFDRKHDLVKKYSGGMKRRINIVCALLHNPKILILDEPTVGIDPQSRNLIFEHLIQLNNQGMTMIYTSHYLEEVEKLCSYIGIMDHGQILAQGTLNELKNIVQTRDTIVIKSHQFNNQTLSIFQKEFIDCSLSNDILTLYVNNPHKHLFKIIELCNNLQIDIQNIDVPKLNLENIFLHLTGKQLRDS